MAVKREIAVILEHPSFMEQQELQNSSRILELLRKPTHIQASKMKELRGKGTLLFNSRPEYATARPAFPPEEQKNFLHFVFSLNCIILKL